MKTNENKPAVSLDKETVSADTRESVSFGTRDVKLTAIPGTPPNLKHPPAGCRFADRCRYATPACKVQQPPLFDIGGGRTYRCSFSVDQLKEVYAHEDE